MLTDEQKKNAARKGYEEYRKQCSMEEAGDTWHAYCEAFKWLLPVIEALEREVKHACHATLCGMEVSGNPEDCDCGWYRASRAVEQTTREAGL